jgi:stage II sporulation protein D
VLISQTDKVEEIAVKDYLFGVVSAEMPALYETEALKAQTVAAYTYAMCKAAKSEGDYDITDDSSIDQAFIPYDDAMAKWGENAPTYEEKIRAAVKSVLYEKITYDGKLILAAYHAISSGKTENAADTWGGNYAYLTSVDSSGDKLSPNYLSTAEFTADELKEKLSEYVTLSGDGGGWIGEISRTETGTVLTAVIGGKSISGGNIRKALSLRSANFDIAFSGGKFTFTVRGYGHGIGMSQYGADYMARQGSSWDEILTHYYPDTEISVPE